MARLGALLTVLAALAACAAAKRPTPRRSARSGKPMEFDGSFLFGAASASYQVEGAWNEDGKGENIWDRLTHDHPEYIRDGCNGDKAADSYHLYAKDVEALEDIGADFYRFSISWSRVLPKGDRSVVNEKGLQYYDNLINALLAKGIEPMVTMFHWDLPQYLQDIGGWPNSVLAEYFEDYARLLLDRYADRVKWWITFNEPKEFTNAYAVKEGNAPSLGHPGTADYLAAHTVLKAHARVWHMYDEEYREKFNGRISITLNSDWMEPLPDDDPVTFERNQEAAERAMQFNLGWFAHPIFSEEGDYPAVMRERIGKISLEEEGRFRSRLPKFTAEEIEYIRGTYDYFGLNHYTTLHAAEPKAAKRTGRSSRDSDMNVDLSFDDSWEQTPSDWLRVVPWGFGKLLRWINEEYNGIPIIVTENGVSDDGTSLEDSRRTNYYKEYISEMWEAMEDGVPVLGYTAWCLVDNFEWNKGYTERFGLYFIDYKNGALDRIRKESTEFIEQIFREKVIPADDDEDSDEGDEGGDGGVTTIIRNKV